jgi:hypothetical protein
MPDLGWTGPVEASGPASRHDRAQLCRNYQWVRGLRMSLDGGTPPTDPFPGPVSPQISLSSLFWLEGAFSMG